MERILVIILLSLSVLLNAALIFEVTDNRKQIDLLRKNGKLTIGEVAEQFVASDVYGNRVSVDFPNDDRKRIFYVYSNTCIWCDNNKQKVERLATRVPSNFNVYLISLEDAGNLFETVPSTERVQHLEQPDIPTRLRFDLTSTPLTIVVSESGMLEKRWKGPFAGEFQKEIEFFLGVSLD